MGIMLFVNRALRGILGQGEVKCTLLVVSTGGLAGYCHQMWVKTALQTEVSVYCTCSLIAVNSVGVVCV